MTTNSDLQALIDRARREHLLLRANGTGVAMMPDDVVHLCSDGNWTLVRWELVSPDVEIERQKRLIAKYEACIRNASKKINELLDLKRSTSDGPIATTDE